MNGLYEAAQACCFGGEEEIEALKGRLVQAADGKLAQLEAHIDGKNWFMGEKLTLADFYWNETFDIVQMVLGKKTMEKYPNLVSWSGRFKAQEWFKKLVEDGKYTVAPYYPPSARYNIL
jgi:glutathione S-transferase